MQIEHTGLRVRGFYGGFNSHEGYPMSVTARHKHRALIFWEKQGLEATPGHAAVSRATLYAWCISIPKALGWPA